MGRFDPILSILPEVQLALFPELKPTVELGFVLYGGTAIALRLGHRQSVDFDFFTDRELDKSQLTKTLAFLAEASVIQESPNGLTFLVVRGGGKEVKLSFFGTIDTGRVGDPELTNDGCLCVASLDDLLATKLKVVMQRIESKDYLDLAALIQSGLKLEKGLAASKALYGTLFQPSECLKALVYFEGGDLSELSQISRKTLVDAVTSVGDLAELEILSNNLGLQH
ncbi:MAG: nucleotidyl transferase AbiEii/AbiGii toxin family protein [Verrucomicrobia bacterium]|nr:nucleotidyl transferase AbiEii/AbiGii toxin family protein [Verrucomicrobiota bacterium]